MNVVPAAAPPVLVKVTELVTEPAVVAVVAEPAVVADVAVAALPVQEPELPVTLIPQLPDAPEPVVDGTPRLDRAVPASVAPVPPLPIARVPVIWVDRLTLDREPPRVSEPEEVTVPVRVRPLTLPVPETLVTVPEVELVPAPIALRKVAASKAETVLSALKRGNVTALGLVIVKRLPPSVVAPSSVRAPPAVVAFVPPLAIGSVPETCEVRLTPESVPPSVIEPDEVTVPVSVRPLTVPAPATEVTVPAPRLVRAVAASVAPVPPLATAKAVPDQFELLIEDRTASEPRPRLVRASAAVEAPVPPSATARSVIPVIEPPVMVTAFEFCVAIVPRPRLVRAPEAVLEPVPPERTGSAVASVSDVR